MTREELIERFYKVNATINNEVLDKLVVLKTEEDFWEFEQWLNKQNFKNDDDYEYFNAAYYQVYGEETEAYITE